MPFNLGTPELVIILIIVILLFGVGRISRIGAEIGRGVNELRKAVAYKDDEKDDKH